MKKSTLLISSLVLSTLLVFGQTNRKAQVNNNTVVQRTHTLENSPKNQDGFIRCITPENELETEADFENWINQKIKEIQLNPSLLKASRNIPVVVHVLHNGDAVGSGENISVSKINSQITALNIDFSATNADFANVPAVFNSAKANVDIQFCLAQTDPAGQPTTGIHRVNMGAGVSSISDSDIETNYGLNNMWDPTKYLNIFVGNLSGGLLGKAFFPQSSGLSGLGGTYTGYDGVMIHYQAFGTVAPVYSTYNKGRTAAHEIGHWLGLRHISGDAACATDYCNDTPPQKGGFGGGQGGLNWGCPTHPYTASGECSGTTAEMFMNYMDYVDDACMYMFTNDQKTRFNAVLLNSPRRKELLTSTVCNTAAITANFTASATVINETQSVTFTDASSSPATLNSWSWTFTGGTPSSSNVQTPPAITYNTAGTYTVTLTVGDNAAGSDTETKVAYITVNTAGSSTCDSTAANWDLTTHGSTTGLYTWTGAGYVLGRNTYGDNGWADKITFSTPGKKLTDVFYFFGVATGTGNLNLKVWGETSAKPGTAIATQSVAISSLATGGTPTLWTLASPPTLSGNFYIGYNHTTLVNGDTAACMSAPTGTNSVWAYESTPVWTDLSAYSVDLGMAIIPVICDISTGEKEIVGNLKEVLVFPNPSQGTINIALTSKVESTIEVYNVVGDLVYKAKPFNTQLITIDVNNHPNGVYFVKVTSNGEVTTKKVILSK